MNSGDDVDNQEDYWFTGSYFKTSLTVIDAYTKKKCLSMQLENLIPEKNIENND